MPKIKKILIANRGEIALRIMKTAKDMGIKTVAVYSEADKLSPHVKYADESILIGPPPSSQSYLDQNKIIEACKKVKADAIHPGYGFLSENASFAKLTEKSGIIFIGPSSKSIEIMGDKLTAKQAVKKYNVPLVPGMDEAIKDISVAKKVAKSVGYPILIKARAGGGGKGMRIVWKEKDLEEEMKRAMSEAKNAFSNDAVFIEKYITSPKHIEVQILGDQHGNILQFFERECTIQRRHQKVIEEAPSISIDNDKRVEIGQAAINVARSCGYYGAGTVEFVMDDKKNFYFLEMNTRLQVEHPVTEMITGYDLVKEQIHIAEGKKLSIQQEDLRINGHSLEIRVYAEDPENNFLPDVGLLKVYKTPEGPGVRVDDGFEEGLEIPIHYDPMISKLITYGKDREEAIQRMLRAIKDYKIVGVKNSLNLAAFIIQHKAFKDGSFTTKFMEEHFKPEYLKKPIPKDILEVAAVISGNLYLNKAAKRVTSPTITSKWKLRNAYR
ncbi:MAG: acetyl/propionyl/methylcrotonyl-CoA carboxylase subunit alpha [Bacteroidota bacterium]